jgi:hypothetical protein
MLQGTPTGVDHHVLHLFSRRCFMGVERTWDLVIGKLDTAAWVLGLQIIWMFIPGDNCNLHD